MDRGVIRVQERFPTIHEWYLVWVVPPRLAYIYENKPYNTSLFRNRFTYEVSDDEPILDEFFEDVDMDVHEDMDKDERKIKEQSAHVFSKKQKSE